jgi:hypothetical protein
MKKMLLIFLTMMLLALPVIAQDEDEDTGPACEIDTSDIATLISDAQALADDGDIDGAVSALEDVRDEVDALIDDCTGAAAGDFPNTPEGAVEGLLTSVFTGDFETAAQYICEEQSGALDALADQFDAQGLGEILALAEIDLSGLEYEVTEDEDDTSVVIEGEIVITVMGQEDTQDAGEVFGGTAIPVVEEDGQWKVCDASLAGF